MSRTSTPGTDSRPSSRARPTGHELARGLKRLLESTFKPGEIAKIGVYLSERLLRWREDVQVQQRPLYIPGPETPFGLDILVCRSGLVALKLPAELGKGAEKTVSHAALLFEQHGEHRIVEGAYLERPIDSPLASDEETRILHKLRNQPHVVRILGSEVVETRPGQLSRVMIQPRYVSDLGELISIAARFRMPLPEDEANRLSVELLEAVAGLHEAGILHLDLKPDNAFLYLDREDTHLHLADFGFSAEEHRSPLLKPTFTPGYESPDFARALLHQDEGTPIPRGRADDVYAAGIILYLIHHLRMPPFEVPGSVGSKVLARSRLTEARMEACWCPRPASVESKDDLIRQMLSPDPAARPTAREALKQFLRLMADPSLAETEAP